MISCVSSRRGKFITFEGLDGCGKSTQMERLAHSLRKQDLSVTVTREPGGTAAGEQTAGQIVLCDRFTDSSEAYQGGGRKLGSKPVHDLHRALVGDLQPDLTILMDSDVAASVDRARRRNRAHSKATTSDENRFEREDRAFFTRVRATYLHIAKREPGRVAMVDARGTPDQTHARILEIVRRKLHLLAAGAKS